MFYHYNQTHPKGVLVSKNWPEIVGDDQNLYKLEKQTI
jgi:hypothetical protein